MRARCPPLALSLLVLAQGALAADLTVTLSDQNGQPVADAVVTVLPQNASEAVSPPPAAPATRTIDQRALRFDPYIEIFRPGDSVVFRNSDSTRHHVYSFSPIRAFEYMVSPGESTPVLDLPQTGVIAVGCNIHDKMVTYLYVSDAPWIARSGPDGRVAFTGLPAGAYSVRAWQPRLRPGKPDLRQTTTLLAEAKAAELQFTLALLPDARLQFDRESTRY